MMIIAYKKVVRVKLLIDVATIVLQKPYNAWLNRIKYGFPSTSIKTLTNICILTVLIFHNLKFIPSVKGIASSI